MKISITKFIMFFLISAFAFQFASNSLLGPEVALFPGNGDWFPGSGSTVTWKSNLYTILYPIKVVLVGPLSSLFSDPDGAPPVLLVVFALYWTAIASALYYLLKKIFIRKNP